MWLRWISPFFVYVLQLVSAFGNPSPSKCKENNLFKLLNGLYICNCKVLSGCPNRQLIICIRWNSMLQIKWICPTAPTRPVAIFGGHPCTACKILFLWTAIFYSFCSKIKLTDASSRLSLTVYCTLCPKKFRASSKITTMLKFITQLL